VSVAPSVAIAVRSTITTASAPLGTAAPVMMRIASPGPSSIEGASPARTVPVTLSTAGRSSVAATVSSARTAKPSIAEFANGGMASCDTTSSASTHPAARSVGTEVAGSGVTAPMTYERASSSEIIR
jgi:hypothetical protein